jgi:hypothetical protein
MHVFLRNCPKLSSKVAVLHPYQHLVMSVLWVFKHFNRCMTLSSFFEAGCHYVFVFVVLKFELRALSLLVKHSST